MQPTKELIDELFWDKVRRARTANPVDKFFDGARLFDFVCRIMKDGIRDRFPDASEQEINRRLSEQVAIARKLENSP
jgi:hypothetical protein